MGHRISVLVGHRNTMVMGTTLAENAVAVGCRHPDLLVMPITEALQDQMNWAGAQARAIEPQNVTRPRRGRNPYPTARYQGHTCQGALDLACETSQWGPVVWAATEIAVTEFEQASAAWRFGRMVQPVVYCHDPGCRDSKCVYFYPPSLLPGGGGDHRAWPINLALRHLGLRTVWGAYDPEIEEYGYQDAFDQVGLGWSRETYHWLAEDYLVPKDAPPREIWFGGRRISFGELREMGLEDNTYAMATWRHYHRQVD